MATTKTSKKSSREPTINAIYKPSKEEQEIRSMVYQRFYDMRDAQSRKDAETEWDEAEKAWRAFNTESSDDWQSDYYIPLTTSVVESILSEFVDQRIRPLILPRGAEDEPKAMVMQHIFEYTWDTANGDAELNKVFKSALIRGTAIAQEYYLKDTRMVKDIIGLAKIAKNKKKFKVETKEREFIEFDGCMMEEVSIWDFFVDEAAREINRGPTKARDCIRRYVIPRNAAKQFFKGPVWDPMNNFRHVKAGVSETTYYQCFKPPTDINKDEVEVLWYWGRTPKDAMYIVINDVVIRMSPNIHMHKQLPFAKAIDVSVIDQFYGRGEPKLLESIQKELNTLRRMVVDRHHLDIDKPFLVGNTVQLDDQDLIARPHMMIPVDDVNNVKPLEYGDIPQSVARTQQSINEDSVRVTGVDDRFQSLQKTPSTATEAAILKESTLKRIKMKILNLSQGFLMDIARQRVANIMQFYSKPRLEKIVGEVGTEEFLKTVTNAISRDALQVRDGEAFEEKFRDIRLEDTELTFNERGELLERPKQGRSFFTIKPEFFMPSAGGFDIKISAGSTLPISKPLQQSKTLELFDRLSLVTETTNYSLEKIADALVRVNDFEPAKLKDVPEQTDEVISEDRTKLLLDLASQENQKVLEGKPIPKAGTPFASPAHTELHIEFLKSPQMLEADDDKAKALAAHIMGEAMAQESRNQGTPAGQTPQQGVVPSNSGPNELENTIPRKIQGGNQVQSGLPPGPARTK